VRASRTRLARQSSPVTAHTGRDRPGPEGALAIPLARAGAVRGCSICGRRRAAVSTSAPVARRARLEGSSLPSAHALADSGGRTAAALRGVAVVPAGAAASPAMLDSLRRRRRRGQTAARALGKDGHCRPALALLPDAAQRSGTPIAFGHGRRRHPRRAQRHCRRRGRRSPRSRRPCAAACTLTTPRQCSVLTHSPLGAVRGLGVPLAANARQPRRPGLFSRSRRRHGRHAQRTGRLAAQGARPPPGAVPRRLAAEPAS
jgi:hypothetical protein